MNQEQKNYAKTPITQATVDFQVQLPSNVSLENLVSIYSTFQEEYPKKRNVFDNVEVEVSVGSEVSAEAKQPSIIGYEYLSLDGKQILQNTTKNWSFNRLAPYSGWFAFIGEARRLWNIYSSSFEEFAITRIGVRYINRINLPLPFNDFKDYFKTIPEVSQELPQELSGFYMQLQIPKEELEAMLIINQALVPLTEDSAEEVSVILDIGIFKDINIPSNANDLWGFLEKVRVSKNQAFEACITDKTRRLID